MEPLLRMLDAYRGLPGLVQDTVLAALLVVLGYLVVRQVSGAAVKALTRSRHVETTVRIFVSRLLNSLGWVLIIVVVLGVYGVDATALVAGLAVGAFIVGFALKDTLGNLAAGVLLLFYRPFRVGEYVSIGSHEGTVQQLGMALTTIKAADGRVVTVPNGGVLGGTIVNHTREAVRRADVVVGIRYSDDIDTAVKAILAAVQADPRVLADPALTVRIAALADSSVNLQVRPWVRTEDYWQARADMHGIVKRAVEAAGCQVPFPQRDIHVFQTGAEE